jgi:hypothetical protein
MSYPSLESLQKSDFKNVFQQRYRDVVGQAISTREKDGSIEQTRI